MGKEKARQTPELRSSKASSSASHIHISTSAAISVHPYSSLSSSFTTMRSITCIRTYLIKRRSAGVFSVHQDPHQPPLSYQGTPSSEATNSPYLMYLGIRKPLHCVTSLEAEHAVHAVVSRDAGSHLYVRVRSCASP